MKARVQDAIDKTAGNELGLGLIAYKIYSHVYWEYFPLTYELGIDISAEQKAICRRIGVKDMALFDEAIKELHQKKYARYYKGKFILRGDDEVEEIHKKMQAKSI